MNERFNFDNYVDRAYVTGNMLLEAGEHDRALECFNKALELDEGFTCAMFHKGLALVNLKRYDEAICCYNMLLDIDPKDTGVLEHKGVALIEINHYEEAAKCYKKLLELEPDNSRAYLKMGHIYQIYGNYKEALSYFDKSLELNYGDRRAWYLKGIVLAEQGLLSSIKHKFNEALKCFEKALECAPRDTDVLKDKAKVLTYLGDNERALIIYHKISDIIPGDPIAITALAKLYKKMNRLEDSLAYYKKLLEINTDTTITAEIEYLTNRLKNKHY